MAFYITTPIYYVNAAPHLGHAYTAIAADALARHHRQRGEDVFFLTGTDEHGEPVALAAEREGVTPQELADRNAERFRALMPQLDVSNDFFIRTTDDGHKLRVQEVLQRVHDNGHVYKGTYEGWYCPRCADFKTGSEIGPDDTCPIHGIPLLWEEEDNWFFRLSSFQEDLERLFREQPDFVQPRQRYNEALSFITGGLNDVSLSRSKLTWGVTVPWDPEHVFYVWFDALLNYYTALGYAREGEDLTDRYWPATFHIIGKDILKFHTVFWPAMLLAAGLEVPKHVFVHGFLLMRDATGRDFKMSKSLGNVLDPFQIIEQFGTDALRYYCLREVSFGQDGGVSTAGFAARYEGELANELGNLASRTTSMAARYLDGTVPAVELDAELVAELAPIPGEVAGLLDRAELTRRAGGGVARSAAAEPLRRGAGAVDAGEVRRGRGARSRARHARRGAARRRRAAASLDAGVDGEDPRCARRAGPGLRRRDPGRRDGAGRPAPRAAVPQARVLMIDSHTHLAFAKASDEELVGAAREAGVTRMLTVGIDGDSCREALRAAERFDDVWAAIGRHPNAATGFADADLDELRELAAHPRCAAIGETGLDFYREGAPREDQERAFRAQIELARETGKPLVIHSREAEDDDDRAAVGARGRHRRDPALLLHAGADRRVPRPRLVDLLRRQRHVPERTRRWPRPWRRCPTTASSSRPTRRS